MEVRTEASFAMAVEGALGVSAFFGSFQRVCRAGSAFAAAKARESSHLRESNPRPPDYKSGALPTELRWRGKRASVLPH